MPPVKCSELAQGESQKGCMMWMPFGRATLALSEPWAGCAAV